MPGHIEVAPGPIRIVARNVGRLTHNVVVERGSQVVARTATAHPGQTVEKSATLRPACSIRVRLGTP